jgi:hypothetical protein
MISFGIYFSKLISNIGLTLFESRNYYSSGSNESTLNTAYYDSQRSMDDKVDEVSIQSDIIEDPFLKLFIRYSKKMDFDISKIYAEPLLTDSLTKAEKRKLRDKADLESFNKYFQISLNDSVVNNVEYFFGDHHGTKGLKTYISSDNCKIGRNNLHIRILDIDSLPKRVWVDHAFVPFWYAEKLDKKYLSQPEKQGDGLEPPKVRTRKNGVSIPIEISK